MSTKIALRPVAGTDEDFLIRVYAGTRANEMELVPWTDQQKHEFLTMQFSAQRADYGRRFPEAEHSIVRLGLRDVGRIWVDRQPEEIRLLDIALLPEDRNKGIGSALLERLIAEARDTATPLRHSVHKTNEAALRFYERLGFTIVDDVETHNLMEWSGGRES